ncbi:MAG: class I SAM-dependent methyltransferase [Hyphomicrobium sp.]
MTSSYTALTSPLVDAYERKSVAYYANARSDFVRLLPRDKTAAVLEVGCGTGATGALALASGRAGRYVGIELMDAAAAEARDVLSEVVTGDVERIELHWRPASFDALILSEVLEHLVDPGRTLQRLSRVLRPGALVLASSPNIAHWRVMKELLGGRFDLADSGVFDRTHLRWFTPESFARLFREAGFRVDSVGPVTPFAPRVELISRATAGRLDHLFMTQIALHGYRT